MTSASPAPRPPRIARIAGDQMATWFIAGVLVVVGGLALLAYETTAVSLAVAVTLLLTVTAAMTAAIFRLLEHHEDESETVA
jgi:uncharacterized membrane protein